MSTHHGLRLSRLSERPKGEDKAGLPGGIVSIVSHDEVVDDDGA